MKNPYLTFPATSFWSSGVRNSTSPVPENLYVKKWPINKQDKIATAGSCFAQHIGRYLKHHGFNVMDMETPPRVLSLKDQKKFGYSIYSARYGNIYTTRQLLQLAKEAFGEYSPADIVWKGKKGTYYDAMRPNVEPEGLDSPGEVVAHRNFHLGRVRKMFKSMDIFIFTLGLTETWLHKETGTIYPTSPGTFAGCYDPKKHAFKNLLFDEIYKDFYAFKKLIHLKQKKNKKVKFLLTVSPVPLTATASDNHVMLATTYSKSILRAVAGQLALENEDIDYFPSYEIVNNPWSNEMYFEENLRSVKEQGVELVMNTFFKAHLNDKYGQKRKLLSSIKNHPKTSIVENDDDVICEEIILDAFRNIQK
jgi:hypothetical protein